MLGYDTNFASIVTKDHADALRKSFDGGRVPYRSDDADRDRNEAVRPVLAPAFGASRNGCDPDVSRRAA
jgi:hypothetical protein